MCSVSSDQQLKRLRYYLINKIKITRELLRGRVVSKQYLFPESLAVQLEAQYSKHVVFFYNTIVENKC